MALLILHCQLAFLAGPNHGVELHGHSGILAPFVGGAGSGQQFPILRRILMDAEHVPALVVQIVALGEALPGEDLLQLGQILPGHFLAVQYGPVDPGDNGHIFRPLHAAFDFQTADAHAFEFVKVLQQTAVFQAQGIAGLLKPAVAVGQAAGLGALAPVAGASADDGGQPALAGIAHAKGAVGKDFNLHGAVLADKGDLFPGQLSGQHHTGAAQFRSLQDTLQRVDAHLGGGVDGYGGRNLAAQLHNTQILHDKGVNTQFGGGADDLGGLPHFPVGDQNIQSQMHLHTADMAVGNGLLQLFHGEVFGIASGVEIAVAKIHRVGAVLHGGTQRIHRPGGRKQFDHIITSTKGQVYRVTQSHCEERSDTAIFLPKPAFCNSA